MAVVSADERVRLKPVTHRPRSGHGGRGGRGADGRRGGGAEPVRFADAGAAGSRRDRAGSRRERGAAVTATGAARACWCWRPAAPSGRRTSARRRPCPSRSRRASPGWKTAEPLGHGDARRVVEAVSRRPARRARGAGRRRQPDAEGGGGAAPPGARDGRRYARADYLPDADHRSRRRRCRRRACPRTARCSSRAPRSDYTDIIDPRRRVVRGRRVGARSP